MSSAITFDDAPAQVVHEAQVSLEVSQKQRTIHPNSLANLQRFQPGQSGNPGGLPRGTPRISDAYRRLMSLSPAELAAFEPANTAESIALARIKAAQTVKGLPDTAEITDRTEGKAPQMIQLNSTTEGERVIIRVQERFLARTGIELTRSEALERLRELDPALAAQLGE